MTALLARLATVCTDHRLREKILVVPSLAIGHQIADALAHGGTPWVNLRVETVRTLADAVAGFALAREGVTVLSRAQALALIERVCDETLDDASYFAAIAGRPGRYSCRLQALEPPGRGRKRSMWDGRKWRPRRLHRKIQRLRFRRRS